jgi:transcription elongation factor SPT6
LKRGREERGNRQVSRGLNDIFSDEELDAPGELDDERRYDNDRRGGEFDDFIESESDDDEDRRMGDGEELRSRRRGTGRTVNTEFLGLREGAMNDMEEIFGLGDYEDALVLEQDTAEMEDRAQDLQLKDVFEPSELKERLLTDEDNAIRWRDEPERFQLARQAFSNLEVSPEELLEESAWIARTLWAKNRHDEELKEPFEEAVKDVLRFFVIDNYEVPFVYHQRRDYLIHAVKLPRNNYTEGEPQYDLHTDKLLYEKDLWSILDLDLKFRAFLEKRHNFKKLYQTLRDLGVEEDLMIEERLRIANETDQMQDLHDYVHFQYQALLRDVSITRGSRSGHRRPGTGRSVFERIRAGKVYGLVRAFGISSEQFAINVQIKKKREFAEDIDRLPHELADDFVDYPDFPTGEQVLLAAKKMLAEEIFYNPRMRLSLRSMWFTESRIDVDVTEKGVKQIDDLHQYYEFKYLRKQDLRNIASNPGRYLKMLKAESEGLININYKLPTIETTMKDLYDYISSENYSEVADAWNRERKEVVDLAMKRLTSMFQKNLRDELRTACEDTIAAAINSAYSKVFLPLSDRGSDS